MTVALLRELGATPEQIDRERERVRAELFGKPEGDGKATAGLSEPRTERNGAEAAQPPQRSGAE